MYAVVDNIVNVNEEVESVTRWEIHKDMII